jgi:uncharacterized protein YndB with AHSA1/START domain
MPRELYSVEREFAVSVERLWRAWTDATELEQWYSPVALEVLPGSVTSEPHTGGAWAVAVDVPMNDMVAYFFGRYLMFDPFERIEHTLHYTQDAGEFAARDEMTKSHLIVLEFESRGPEMSWVRFSQVGDMPDEQIDITRSGTESYFDNLEIFLI